MKKPKPPRAVASAYGYTRSAVGLEAGRCAPAAERLDDQQQNHGADERDHDAAQIEPVHSIGAGQQQRKYEAAQEPADDTYDDVTEQAKAGALNYEARQLSGNRADDDPHDDRT